MYTVGVMVYSIDCAFMCATVYYEGRLSHLLIPHELPAFAEYWMGLASFIWC